MEGPTSPKSQTPTGSECWLGFGARVASTVFILPAVFLRASDSTFFTVRRNLLPHHSDLANKKESDLKEKP